MSVIRNKKIILTVDDVSMNLAVIKNILSKHFDVRQAKSGELALFILRSVKVDLILLDIEMPEMSGFDLINAMQDMPDAKDIPIIFVTSHANAGFIGQAIQVGAKDYIVKPIDPNILKEKVFKVLNMPMPYPYN